LTPQRAQNMSGLKKLLLKKLEKSGSTGKESFERREWSEWQGENGGKRRRDKCLIKRPLRIAIRSERLNPWEDGKICKALGCNVGEIRSRWGGDPFNAGGREERRTKVGFAERRSTG